MESITHHEDTMKQPTFALVDISPHFLLAIFNVWLGYSLIEQPAARVSVYLAQYLHWPVELISGVTGMLLLLTGISVFIFTPRNIRWLILGSIPLLVYNVTTAGVVLTLPDRPGGGEVISIMVSVLLFAYYSLHLTLHLNQATIQALSAEIARLNNITETK